MKLLKTLTTAIVFLPLTSQALDLVNLKDFPKWFNDAIEKETELKQSSSFELKAFGVKSKVKGKLALIEGSEGYWYYNIDIGTSTPVECHVFTEFDGPANSLYNIIEHSLDATASRNEKDISGKFNFAIDSGIVGDSPYLAFDTLYHLGKGKNKLSGIVKGRSMETEHSLQICVHNEIGYRETFQTVFESFVNGFITSEQDPEFFEPVYKMTFNNIPIGYAREKYTTDADGDVSIKTDTAMLFPVNANEVSRSDSVSSSWSTPSGDLINGTEYSVENSTLASQFSIQYAEDKWQVEGQLQGKAVNAVLEHKEPLLSNFGSYLETATLRQSEEDSAGFKMWMADADPTAAVSVNIAKVKDDPTQNVKLTMGPMTVGYLADENGVFQRGSIKHGPLEMHLELIYSNGKPVIP